MKSPITGREMSLRREERTMDFRKEKFPVLYHYYLCEDSAERFTSTALDELNMLQLYNQYRDKHNLPFPEEVREIREKYGLPASKMADILGLGANSYRNYENGEVPNHSNAKLIQLAGVPEQFRALVELSDALDVKAKAKLLRKLAALIDEEIADSMFCSLEDYLLDGDLPDEFSGYRKPNLKHLTEMVVFFSKQFKPWKTQLNKLLFYADFLMFKHHCISISGTRYRAVQMGPILHNYNSIFEYMSKRNEVDITPTAFLNGSIGEQFSPHAGRKFNPEVFLPTELEVLHAVANKFKGATTKDMIKCSHAEQAWKANVAERKMISYKFAFELWGI